MLKALCFGKFIQDKTFENIVPAMCIAMKFATLVLVALTVITVSALETDISEDQKFENLTQSLGYGEKCAWPAEKSRQGFTKEAFTTVKHHNGLSTASAFRNSVLLENEPLCSTTKMTICDKETQRCKCGDPARQMYHPNLTDGNDYVVETDENGDQHCRWVEGGYCLSRDMLEATGIAPIGYDFDLQCQEGTECLRSVGGRDCSIFALLIHMLQKYPDTSSRSLRQMSLDIFKGEVCKCQPVDYYSESEEEARIKRSIPKSTKRSRIESLPVGAISIVVKALGEMFQ